MYVCMYVYIYIYIYILPERLLNSEQNASAYCHITMVARLL